MKLLETIGELSRVAWRNVWRNTRRTTLNVIALTLGMAILLIALGWINGYHIYVYETIRDFETGELQVLDPAWYPDRSRLPLDALVEDYDAVRERVAAVGGVDAATGRVRFSLRVSTGTHSFRALGTAIDPRFEHQVGALDENIVAGRTPAELGEDGRGAWVGQPVAERAGIEVGDTIFLRAVNRHGVDNLYDAAVVGIFTYGYPVLDRNTIYVDRGTADELLDLGGAVTHVVVRTTERASLTATGERVRDALGIAGAAATSGDDGRLEVRPWQDFARSAVSAVEQDTISFTIMIGVLYLLIVLGILNSVSMSVHERTREIGTLRAIGMQRGRVTAMFALESVWTAAIATLAALAVSTPVIVYLATVGVDLTGSLPDDLPIPFGERFRAEMIVGHYLFTIASGVLAALVGAIVPARRAARVTVAEAMRSVG